MNLGFPDHYPSTVNLPFNNNALNSAFTLSTPDKDPGTPGCWLALQGHSVITDIVDGIPQLPHSESPLEIGEQQPLFIGDWHGKPCRAVKLDDEHKIPAALSKISLMDRNPQIEMSLLSLAGTGLMTLHWESRSQFCSICGHSLVPMAETWAKKCSGCKQKHYPCISSCAIGLVMKGDETLLIRKPEWKDGRYGLVSGFVEFGECFEEAIVREVREETNIAVKDVRYAGSQSWPFPNQIMSGYIADYADGEISIQNDEIADANWFKLDDLPVIPPKRSIARHLIDLAVRQKKCGSVKPRLC